MKAKKYLYQGEERTLREWCQILNKNITLVYSRLRSGKTFEEALKPLRWSNFEKQNRRKEEMIEALRSCAGVQAKAAIKLGISRQRFQQLVKRYNIPKSELSYYSKKIFYNGEWRSLGEWCRILGLKYSNTAHRIYSGWSIEEALSIPPNGKRQDVILEKERIFQKRKSEIIDALRKAGGKRKVAAKILGVYPSKISEYKKVFNIPPEEFVDLRKKINKS
jgi:transcriptional regulator with GAF, ATPase, and Fis domain